MAKRNYNGEGTIYYSEKLNRYVAQFTDPFTKKRKTLYDKDEKTLKKKLRDAIKDAENGKYVEKSKDTIPQIAEKIIERKHEANITNTSSYLRALGTLNIINKSEIAKTPIQNVTKDDLQEFFYTLKDYSNSYIAKIYQIVKLAFDEAIKDELIIKNPMIHIIKPRSNKQDKKVEALTLEQHQKFLASLNNEIYNDIFLVAINTGKRCGEILALQPNDIDFENNVIKVSKTITRNDYDAYTLKKGTKTYAGTREIPFDSDLKNVLINSMDKQENNEFGLIYSLNSKIIRPSTLNIVFKRICRNLNFEGNYNFHMLRHTFATRCIESGMPAHVLQKLLGHTDVSITINTYTSIFDKYKKEEFDKFLEYKKANNI
jgi:integrase